MSNIEKRQSDVIFDMLNRINEGKKNGSLRPNELAKTLVLVGDLGANKIKQGKMDEDSIEAFEATFPKINYFDYNHKGIEQAYKTAMESIDIAKENNNQRNMNQTVSSYTKGLRRAA